MLNSEIIKQKAREFGADLVGIGDITLFAGTTPQRDPLRILPKAKCIIGCGFRVPRALYRAMDSQRQVFDEELAEIFLLKMGGLIEDEGYDACLQRNVSNLRIKGDHSTNPELIDTYELVHAEPVAPGKPAPDIIIDFAQAAQICGLGAAGAAGNIIVPKFGPFVRFVFIVTDAPLETDPPFGQSLCDLYTGICSMSREDGGTLASITLGLISAVLTGLGVFDRIAKYAGAGTLVPITGFANAVASPAIDARSEGLILGVGAKIFTVAGPVLLYGTLAGAFCGVIFWIIGLCTA